MSALISGMMRAWIARRQQKKRKPPSAQEVKDVVGEAPADKVPPRAAES